MSQRFWCALSGHGFGHLSQMAPLLEQLAEHLPDAQFRIVTSLPQSVLERLLTIHFSVEHRPLDVGLVQPEDPMRVDLPATAAALRALHGNWEQHIDMERQAMAAWQPDLLLANIPYLAIAAAADLGIPTVAIASLSWDAVLAAYFDKTNAEIQGWWHTMRQAYARTTLALLPAPAITADIPFPHVAHINPLTTPGQCHRSLLRQTLGIATEDNRPVILVSLGGIPARYLPLPALAQEHRIHWLLDIPLPDSHPGHLHNMIPLLGSWSFANLAASVDGVVSKPGYGMAIAAGAGQIPFLYRRRGTFPDESPICTWLEQVGRCLELTEKAFHAGDWYDPIQELLAKPAKPLPLIDGAKQGAELLTRRFFLLKCRAEPLNSDISHNLQHGRVFLPNQLQKRIKTMALRKFEAIISEEEYLRGELDSEIKHEFIDGYVYAMTGAKKQHNRLAATINGEFRNHLKGKPCDAFQSDFKVRIGTKYFYPDIIVECDSDYNNEDYTEHPIMIVEVTSESTQKFDRTYKLDVYKKIPSLQEYVIIEQYKAMVDIYRRAGHSWNLQTYRLGDTVHFESIGLNLTVEEIYERVDNEEMQAYLKAKEEEQKTG